MSQPEIRTSSVIVIPLEEIEIVLSRETSPVPSICYPTIPSPIPEDDYNGNCDVCIALLICIFIIAIIFWTFYHFYVF